MGAKIRYFKISKEVPFRNAINGQVFLYSYNRNIDFLFYKLEECVRK